MKNKFLSIIGLFLLLLIPVHTFATTDETTSKEYVSMNLEETLAEEEIEPVFSDYKETDDQITIYMFRGKGCGYCKSFLNYINSITDEYGKYFKVRTYEVWYNSNNSELMTEVSDFLEEPATGVPYIIIGDKVFPGYADVYNEDIKTAITELYNSKDRYDVLKEIEKEKTLSTIKNIVNTCIPAICIIGTIIVLIYTDKKYRKLNVRINELEEKINAYNNPKHNNKETENKKENNIKNKKNKK